MEKKLTALFYPPCWILGETATEVSGNGGDAVTLDAPCMASTVPIRGGQLAMLTQGLGVPAGTFAGWLLARPATGEERRAYQSFRMSLSGLAEARPS